LRDWIATNLVVAIAILHKICGGRNEVILYSKELKSEEIVDLIKCTFRNSSRRKEIGSL
jgi:hypothetical protein